MRRLVSVLVAIALAGCASNTVVEVNTAGDGAPPTAGTTVRSGGLHVESASGSMAAALAALILLGVWIHGDTDNAFGDRDVLSARKDPPEMDPDRKVNEQDCTRPVEPGANLRCR